MTPLVRGRPATVKDVARHAGVSASTVSNVLHGRASVAEAIRGRVEAAIAEVGYVPSVVGRQLRSGTSEVIQLALPDIRSPYYSALAHTVIQRARELGLTVVIDETGGAVEQEQRVAAGHPHRGIGGTLICPMSLTSDDLADLRPATPTVLLGEHTRSDEFDQVFIDSRAAAREVAAHLVATGRTRFAFVGTEHGSEHGSEHTEHGTAYGPGSLRLDGVRDVLRAEGLDLPASAVLDTPNFGRDAGVAAGERLPVGEAGFDAVVCATDELAVGVLHALARRGVEVPRDVAVTGWDDAPESRFVTPALTTVAHDLDDLAEAALGFVIARKADPGRRPGRHVAPHRLVVRGSTVG